MAETSSRCAIAVAISADPLDVVAALSMAADRECGGLGLFVGTVRTTPAVSGPSRVQRLDYDVHEELATASLQEIAAAAAAQWDLRRIVALHRSGECSVGDVTVIIACAAPHRSDALDACRFVIDEVKTKVPIWKREVYADGSTWLEPHA